MNYETKPLSQATALDRKVVANAKADAIARVLPIHDADWRRILVILRDAQIDPHGAFCSLSTGDQRVVLALAYYAARRLDATVFL
jgi:hypothetical protein